MKCPNCTEYLFQGKLEKHQESCKKAVKVVKKKESPKTSPQENKQISPKENSGSPQSPNSSPKRKREEKKEEKKRKEEDEKEKKKKKTKKKVVPSSPKKISSPNTSVNTQINYPTVLPSKGTPNISNPVLFTKTTPQTPLTNYQNNNTPLRQNIPQPIMNQNYGQIRPQQYVTGFGVRKFNYPQTVPPVYSMKNPLFQPQMVNQYSQPYYVGYPMSPVVIVQPINQMMKRITPTEPDNTSHFFNFPSTPQKK